MAIYQQDRELLMAAVGGLYEAAANPALWPQSLNTVAALFCASGAQISILNAREAHLSLTVMVGIDYDQRALDRYAELSVTDPLSLIAIRLAGKALRCGHVANREEIVTSPMYREVLRPAGIEYRMGVVIGDIEMHFCALSVVRGRVETDFDDEDVALLSDLAPHFRRAIDIYEALASRQAGEGFALGALDTLSIGVAVVDAMRSVLFMNVAGKAIVEDKGGLLVRNGHLMAERTEDLEQLSRAVLHMATADNGVRSEFIAFHRSDGREPLSATISPLDRRDDLPVPGVQARDLAIVIFTDPERQLEVPEELLQRLYGLTPAEAALLAALVGGHSLDAAAEALGIVKETARKRLREVFQKTGTNRQAELVRHVLANPVWITEQAKRPAPIGEGASAALPELSKR